MKKSLVFFIVLIFGIVIFGIATLQSGVLLLSIPLIVYLFSAIYHQPEDVQLSIVREISPNRGFPGTPITVKLTVTNQGGAVDELLIKDMLPKGIQIKEGEASLVAALKHQASVEIEYLVEGRRGQYDIFEMTAYSRDFCGFFEHPITYRTETPLLIKPSYPRLERFKIRPPQTRGFAGPIAARQGGVGVDFFGVREYQPGDPQRQINWKIAARYNQEIFTNIYEQERVADVGIVLDARQSMDVAAPFGSLFEYSVVAAASFAEYFLQEGNRVSLLLYGGGIANVFPGYGKFHQDRILKVLAKANPEKNFALDNLALLPTRLFPARSQIVVISPLAPHDIPVYVQMRAHGYAVIVVSPDPVLFEAAQYNDRSSLAYRIASAERNLLLQQIQRYGVQVVNWRVDQPLELAVRKALSRQPALIRQHGLQL
jgi:uncharacterized protein (DUF58 family)